MQISVLTRATGALALTAALAQVSCGGGAGELLVASFLGTGGGSYQAEPVPRPADYSVFDDSLTISLSATDIVTTAPDLYASAYDVFVANVNGDRLAACKGASGRVEGTRVNIPGCFTGEYVTLNRLKSDDGTMVLHHVFNPDLLQGLWVDVNDASHAFKFIGGKVACEYVGTTPRSATYQIISAALIQDGGPGTEVTEITAAIESIVVTGGATWSGEFIGISGLKLTSGSTTIQLQRRNQAPPAPCA